MQLFFQLHQELVHHAQNDFSIERCKRNDRVNSIAEFRREHALDVGHLVAQGRCLGEADLRLVQGFSPSIRCHDDDHVAEIGFPSVVIRQCAVIHHLQQDVKYIRMRFFDFIQQQHAMGLFAYRFGEQTALIKADIARRRTDQARHGMALHVFGHIETVQRHAHRKGQLTRDFGFSHTGRTRKQEAAYGFIRVAKTAARHLDRGSQCVDGCVLAEHHRFQIAIQRFECIAIIVRHGARRDARDLRNDFLDLVFADHFFLL